MSGWTEGIGTGTGTTVPPEAAFVAAAPLTPEDVRRARRWLIALGILGVVAGLLAIAVPAAASVTVAIFIGWLLVFSGVLMAGYAFSERPASRVALRLLDALLALAAGIYLIAAPLTGTVTLTFVLAVWFFVSAALQLYAAWRHRGEDGAALAGVNGILSLLLGSIVAADLPGSAAWAIGLLVGVNLLFWGVRLLTAASALRNAAS
jgi:uncharacterized membrane protein HdeD (DUF308 family)